MTRKKKWRRLPYDQLRILIVVEGQTEQQYFFNLANAPEYKTSLGGVKVEIVIKRQASKKTAEKIIKMMERADRIERPYTQVWWVIDHDNNPNRKEGYDEARKMRIRIAFSAFAFEQWYLLHFAKSAKCFSDVDSLIKALKKYIPDYEKARQNDYDLLKDKLPTAYKNTKWLRDNLEDKTLHITEQNPYTDVDILVQNLIDIGES